MANDDVATKHSVGFPMKAPSLLHLSAEFDKDDHGGIVFSFAWCCASLCIVST